MIVGLLGGTGAEGIGLALRLGQAGYQVQIGSRSAMRAREKAVELMAKLKQVGVVAVLTGGENAEVVAVADVVFLTAPFERAVDLVMSCLPAWRPGCVLVDVTVPLIFQAGGVDLRKLPEDSASEHLAKRLPKELPLVAAFKTIPARLLADLGASLDCDLFVCGDSAEAKSRVMEIASRFLGLRPLDAGPLLAARTLERMTLLAIDLNRRYKVKAARFRVAGL